ncbi:hypothetical protein BJX99DRAFT_242279 [Aspergillus californicus]
MSGSCENGVSPKDESESTFWKLVLHRIDAAEWASASIARDYDSDRLSVSSDDTVTPDAPDTSPSPPITPSSSPCTDNGFDFGSFIHSVMNANPTWAAMVVDSFIHRKQVEWHRRNLKSSESAETSTAGYQDHAVTILQLIGLRTVLSRQS